MAVLPQYREGGWPSPDGGGLQLEALANLAHELRTPVQVMLGYIETLRDELTRATPPSREIVERMNVNAYDLACAVENVMDFAAVDLAGDPSFEEEVGLVEFFDDIEPILQAINSHKHLAIEIDLESAPPAIHCCRRALRAIVVNLATNAIKFTPSGSVTIAAWGTHHARRDAIELEVRDTGPGIRPEMVPDAFAPFIQLSRANTRIHRGLGLGLAVVQRNVDALGGELEVRSLPGEGSTFRVTLPCRAIRRASAAA